MASRLITSWQTDGETMETVTDFIFLGSRITVDTDYSHKIKRCLSFEEKLLDKPRHVLKSRDIALLTKVRLVKAMAFPVVTYRCESWIYRRLRAEEFMLSNCGAGEDSEEPLNCKQVKPVNPKGNQS